MDAYMEMIKVKCQITQVLGSMSLVIVVLEAHLDTCQEDRLNPQSFHSVCSRNSKPLTQVFHPDLTHVGMVTVDLL